MANSIRIGSEKINESNWGMFPADSRDSDIKKICDYRCREKHTKKLNSSQSSLSESGRHLQKLHRVVWQMVTPGHGNQGMVGDGFSLHFNLSSTAARNFSFPSLVRISMSVTLNVITSISYLFRQTWGKLI